MRAVRRLVSMRRPRRGEDGYVLATAVALSFIVILTVMAVVTIQLANIEATRRSIGQQQSRAAGESALDQAYVKFLRDLQSDSLADPSTSLGGTFAEGSNWKWYRAADPTAICSIDATEVCFHIEVKGEYNDYLMEVTSRSRCVGGTLNLGTGSYTGPGARCIVTKYQQRIRKKQFFDYLHFTNRETVSPAWYQEDPNAWSGNWSVTDPPVVAYTGGDVLDGPVRTNGQISICLRNSSTPPEFKQGVYAVTENFNEAGCGAAKATAGGSEIDEATKSPELAFPDATALEDLKTISQGMGLYQATATRITFEGVNYKIGTGSSKLIPKNAVFFFDKPVTVTGTVDGNVTVATKAGQDIRIEDNLLYECRDETAMASGGPSNDCDDSLGLIAGRNIEIRCSPTGDSERYPLYDIDGEAKKTPRCESSPNPRYLVGAFLALGLNDNGTPKNEDGIIAVQRWATANPATPLYFYGTTASRFRPVWGLADADDGTTVRGLSKNFTFDKRLKNRQPPSFLEPNNAPWERIDLIEVAPCAGGINGPPKGAGCP